MKDMKNKDIRWKQRLSNLEKANSALTDAVNIPEPDLTQKAGIIQLYEITFELAWKVMRDYMISQGVTEVDSPRSVIKKAFRQGLITEGELWLKALEDRNTTSHIYDEHMAEVVVRKIRDSYYNFLSDFLQRMKNE